MIFFYLVTDLSNDPNISQNDFNSQPSHDGSSSNEQRFSRAEIDDIFIDDFDLEVYYILINIIIL